MTRSYRNFVVEKARGDIAFRAALVEEAARNVLDGDVATAIGQIRDVVNATIGFDVLAAETGIGKTSLMRMLGRDGNPRAENLGAILRVLGQQAGVRMVVRAEPVGAD